MTASRLALPATALLAMSVVLLAEARQSSQPPAQPSPPAVEKPDPAASPGYTYQRDGRRDPFVSLVGRAGDVNAAGSRPPGLPGFQISEVSLKGIMRQSGGFVALLQGSDKRTYVARPGQRLFDGSVKAINPDGVVFSQDVNDPLSTVKQREVRKTLRSTEEGQG